MKPNLTDNYASKGMRYPAINDLVAKANNKYELVVAAAKRAREIIEGSEPLVKITIDNSVSIATAEIAQDLVRPVQPPEIDETENLDEAPVFPEEMMLMDVETTAEMAEEL